MHYPFFVYPNTYCLQEVATQKSVPFLPPTLRLGCDHPSSREVQGVFFLCWEGIASKS